MFQTLFKSVTKQAVILYLYIEFHQVSLGYIAKNPLEVLETGRIKKMQSLHSGWIQKRGTGHQNLSPPPTAGTKAGQPGLIIGPIYAYSKKPAAIRSPIALLADAFLVLNCSKAWSVCFCWHNAFQYSLNDI